MTSTSERSYICTPKSGGGGAALDAPQLLADCPYMLTVQDLHRLTGLSEQTIRAEINSGSLPGCRIGRRLYIPKTHLLEYIENGGGLK